VGVNCGCGGVGAFVIPEELGVAWLPLGATVSEAPAVEGPENRRTNDGLELRSNPVRVAVIP
jgi:hypothetical protein